MVTKTKNLCVVVAVILAAILFAGCFDLDDSLFNRKPLSSYALSTLVIPEAHREFVELNSQGKKIYGYFVTSNGVHPDVTILYCQGNKYHLQFYWDRVELLYRTGCNVFIFDYQGFGMSEGTPSEGALYADGHAALEYLLNRPGVDRSKLVFYGFSLGNVVTFNLGATEFTPKVIIAEAPFASADALVQSGALLDIPGSYVMKGEYRNDEKIKAIHAPFLLMHGIDDKFIDLEKNSAVIFRNANDPKEFIRVPGADHPNLPAAMGETAYCDTVKNFISRYQDRSPR